jgi:hypothetical protein
MSTQHVNRIRLPPACRDQQGKRAALEMNIGRAKDGISARGCALDGNANNGEHGGSD